MIVTVTPNAALDITYTVDALIPGGTHRVHTVRARAGGKGVNVTSVLMAMGYPTLATGFAGGPPGQTLLADLTDRGVPHLFTDVLGSSRRNISVHADDGTLTLFNEPGPPVPAAAWEHLRVSLEPLIVGPATALVFSGKLPVGSPAEAAPGILDLAHRHGVPTVVDAAGHVLLSLVRARPAVIKPSRAELAEVCPGLGVVDAARELQARGARDVVVTLGADGVVVVPEAGPVLRARLTEPVEGEAMGAGDALAAAIATGVGVEPWETLVRRAVAWSAAAMRQPVTGVIDPADVVELEALARVEQLVGDAA